MLFLVAAVWLARRAQLGAGGWNLKPPASV